MRFFPKESFICIDLRQWCIYGGLLEFFLFLIPSFYYLIVWNEKQEDNRILFGVILICTLTLSVCLGIGGYNNDPFFIMVWIIGTLIVQYFVNIFYSFLFLLKFTKVKIWGYSKLEITFTLVQSVIGLFLLYTAAAYYTALQARYNERVKEMQEQMEARKRQIEQYKRAEEDRKRMEEEKRRFMEEERKRKESISKAASTQTLNRSSRKYSDKK